MWTWLLILGCTPSEPPGLAPEGVTARTALAQALGPRDPLTVQAAVEHAVQWEGQDPALDRLLGDALANVLMHVEDGRSRLAQNPDPDSPSWTNAFLLATARTGDVDRMTQAWTELGRAVPPLSNPVTLNMVQRLKGNPEMTLDAFEKPIYDCALMDAQPPLGRSALDNAVSEDLLKVAPWVGADSLVMGRPKTKSDPDPDQARGPVQCGRKILLESWPVPMSKTLTVGMSSGNKRVFIDIQPMNGEAWAYAASDKVAGGAWVKAMNLARAPDAEALIRERFPDGLWATEQTP
jgi:hypothetical protein